MSGHTDAALEALRRYCVAPQRVRLAAASFNTVFRVTTASAVYALRVGSALRIHPEGTTAAEAAWHRRLRQQGVHVLDVLANLDGGLVTVVADDRTGHGTRVCALFDWVAGRSLRTRLTGRRSAALGRLSARLHRDAVAWSPPGAGDLVAAGQGEPVPRACGEGDLRYPLVPRFRRRVAYGFRTRITCARGTRTDLEVTRQGGCRRSVVALNLKPHQAVGR